tara:strand:+ start:3990 stop:5234 length:1245 start_codon:yes stop_codon:yes gene_type:complete
MNIQEMHLSVMQGVDKIHAQVADTILTSELDRELNKAIQKFVTTRFQKGNKYFKGFEESQKRRDDLRTLVRETILETSFKEQLQTASHPGGALFTDTVFLPSDYMYLININTEIKRLPTCTPIGYNITDQDPVYYFIFSLNDFVGQNQFNDSTEWISQIQMFADVSDPTTSVMEPAWEWGTSDWTTENEPTVFPSTGTGFNEQPDNQNLSSGLVQCILDEWQLGEIFWENWPIGGSQISYPNSFIAVVDIEAYPWLNFDGSLGDITYLAGFNSDNFITVQTPLLFKGDVLNQKRIPTSNTWGSYLKEKYSCRMVQHDDIHSMIGDPFNKTKYSSPLTVMRGNHIDVYTDDVFITDKIRLTYIRQPAVVNLQTGLSCDLPDHTHEEVVRLAVASILEAISDPRYATHAGEVQSME